jgi:hypothetical protein
MWRKIIVFSLYFSTAFLATQAAAVKEDKKVKEFDDKLLINAGCLYDAVMYNVIFIVQDNHMNIAQDAFNYVRAIVTLSEYESVAH